MDSSLSANRARSVAKWTLVWSAACGIFVTQNASRYLVRGQSIDWFQALTLEAIYWLPFLVLTPVLLAAVRRFPIGGPHTRGNVAWHLAVMLVIGVVQVAVSSELQIDATAIVRPTVDVARYRHSVWLATPGLLITAFWKYWVFVGVSTAFDSHRRLRDREVRAAQLEAQLATAQLQALKAQLHPHFLFNTLHSISMLNFVDVEAANRILVQLSDLLRLALDRAGALDVKLAEEVDFLERYLAIEQVRFEDRLKVRVDVDETVREAAVPNLILQPLVENALRHGIAPYSGAGRLAIRARRGLSPNTLVLEVEDDGPGLPLNWSMTSGAGVGLANVRDRLNAANGDRATLDLISTQQGVLARIVLPLEFRRTGTRA